MLSHNSYYLIESYQDDAKKNVKKAQQHANRLK